VKTSGRGYFSLPHPVETDDNNHDVRSIVM